jgi:hypothetical protein
MGSMAYMILTARFYHLPKGVFLHLKYLEKLVLYGNIITGWGNGYEIPLRSTL